MKTIRSRGFSVADPPVATYDPEPYAPPAIVDWDTVAGNRLALLPNRSARRRAA